MRVRIAFTVDIDADAWSREYGTDHADVRIDVQDYVSGATIEHLASLGLLTRRDGR